MVAFRTEDLFLGDRVRRESIVPRVLRMHPQKLRSGYVPGTHDRIIAICRQIISC